jgi:hypothetical protein
MHALVAIMIAIAATAGIRMVYNRATVAGQRRYAAARTRLADWRAEQAKRPKPPPSPLAIKLGAVAGGSAHGAVLAWRAGVPGWRLGWAQGRERVQEWWAQRRAEPPVTDPAAESAEPVQPAVQADVDQPQGRPVFRIIRNDAEPEPSGGAMPVIETTTGEVRTVADIRAKVLALIKQYTAELDDAQAKAARKKASMDEVIATAEASTEILDRDADGSAAVAELVEPARQAWLSAQADAANADRMLGQAQAALAKLNAHRGMEEATAATPQASTNTEAYQPQ